MNQVISSCLVEKKPLRSQCTSYVKDKALDTMLHHTALWLEKEHRGTLTRVEELVMFAKQMRMKKIGIAYCSELVKEAKLFADILEMQGFNAVMITCSTKKDFTCNPLLQAKSLNRLRTELNVTIGLCLGYDMLFMKHATALTTCLITKDHVLEHHPLLGLYMSNTYGNKNSSMS